jgi:hypothetical protein
MALDLGIAHPSAAMASQQIPGIISVIYLHIKAPSILMGRRPTAVSAA